LFLISTMAMHTHNLQSDPRASLLITQPTGAAIRWRPVGSTLMGEAHRLDAGDIGHGARRPTSRGTSEPATGSTSTISASGA
jgi:hypothetical protein